MSDEEGREYFAGRKMGRILLQDPYSVSWWQSSKYKLCLDEFEPLPRDARVLDLGCGLGTTAFRLAEVAGRVTGVDLSSFAIDFAREHYRRDDLEFVCADIFDYQASEPVDAVFCMDLIEHLEPERGRELIGRIAAALEPGGFFYAHVPVAESRGGRQKLRAYLRKHGPTEGILDHSGDPTHRNTFSVRSFQGYLRDAGFEIVRDHRKMHFWRPLRWLCAPLVRAGAPQTWKNEATYSYVVQARRGASS